MYTFVNIHIYALYLKEGCLAEFKFGAFRRGGCSCHHTQEAAPPVQSKRLQEKLKWRHPALESDSDHEVSFDNYCTFFLTPWEKSHLVMKFITPEDDMNYF